MIVKKLQFTIKNGVFELLSQVPFTGIDIPYPINGTLTIGNEQLTMSQIIEVACKYFEIDQSYILSKFRYRNLSLCRFIIIYLTRKHTNMPLKAIGWRLGGRDHSTVVHAISALQNDMIQNQRFNGKYISIIVWEIEQLIITNS